MLIETVERPLTAEEQAYVAPRDTKIQQLTLIIAGAKKGDRWLNQRQRELRSLNRQLRNYLFDRSICRTSYRDERGQVRELDATDPLKVTIY